MSKKAKKKLGVIGGVGPAATSLLFERVIEHTEAFVDQDHLNIAVLNYPELIPDRTEYLLDEEAASFVEPIQGIAKALESLGCEVIAMPCNTAHSRFDEISGVLRNARLLHMPRETAEFAREKSVKKCGVLATDGTLHSNVYETALSGCDIKVVVPDDRHQKRVMEAIYGKLKAGDFLSAEGIGDLFDPFIQAGCDGVILGCTELSLMDVGDFYKGIKVIDALDILAKRSVVACGARLRNEASPVGHKE